MPTTRLTRVTRLVAVLLCGTIILGACGDKDPLAGDIVKDASGCSPDQVPQDKDHPPTVEPVTGKVTALKTKDLRKGTGCKAGTGQFLAVDLLGATADDGKVFRSSWTDGRPVNLELGKNQLIKGLELGMAGMKVGGRRQITIPADQAYGKEGEKSLGIGKDEALTFVVDLLAATDAPVYCNAGGTIPKGQDPGKPTQVIMPIKAPTKVKTTDIEPGVGPAAKKGNYLVMHYLGMVCSTGQQFQSSWDNAQPFNVTIGEGTIPGFSKGLVGAKNGMLRQIEIPAAEAYGATGQQGAGIGPNEPLVFIVRILELQDKPPAPTTTTAPTSTTTPGSTTTTTAAKGATTTTTAAK